jgi:hypothetical protein
LGDPPTIFSKVVFLSPDLSRRFGVYWGWWSSAASMSIDSSPSGIGSLAY